MLKVTSRWHEPEDITQPAYEEENSELVLSEELMYFYGGANLEKLEKYLKTLTSLLTPQEINDLEKPQHNAKIELVYLGAGLYLNSDRTYCYVPEKYSKGKNT